MPLDDLKKFSLTKNLFEQVVKPLYESVHFHEQSETALKKMLRDDIHKAFWKKTGPAVYDSALGGKFQEILDAYKHTVLKDHHAQLGAIAGIGGDTVITKLNEEGREFVKTIQFKTVDSGDVRGVEENIAKAAWQLCGHGGEKPADGSVCTIEVVLLNTVAFDAYDDVRWAKVIREALSEGYRQADKYASPAEIFATVDEVKLTTRNWRFKFEVDINGAVTFIKKKATKLASGYTFRETNFAKQWNWLKDTWWTQKIAVLDDKDTLITATRDKGIGAPGAWDNLPLWKG